MTGLEAAYELVIDTLIDDLISQKQFAQILLARANNRQARQIIDTLKANLELDECIRENTF